LAGFVSAAIFRRHARRPDCLRKQRTCKVRLKVIAAGGTVHVLETDGPKETVSNRMGN